MNHMYILYIYIHWYGTTWNILKAKNVGLSIFERCPNRNGSSFPSVGFLGLDAMTSGVMPLALGVAGQGTKPCGVVGDFFKSLVGVDTTKWLGTLHDHHIIDILFVGGN